MRSPHVCRRSARVAAVLALITTVALLQVGPPARGAAAPTAGDASTFEPLTPCRLTDTRAGGTPISAGVPVEIPVAGECGVPDDATAVAVTVTVVRPAGAGFLTVGPSGEPLPGASASNFRSGQVVANLQLVRLGDGGALTVSSTAGTHLVVDVAGAFVAADGPTSAGRYVPVEGRRVLDTRTGRRPAPGSSVVVDPDVPDDASAVAVNLTAAASPGFDFLTAYPAGESVPDASAVNVDRPGQARAAAIIVPLTDGEFEVFTYGGSHVIVDVLGYFTGSRSDASTDGMFVPITPTRLADTRDPAGPTGGPRLYDHGGREFPVTDVTGGPVAAIAMNVTVTRTEDRGFVTAHPAGSPVGPTSTVNYVRAGDTVANQTLARVSERGVAVTAEEATHLVLDVTGWFTGTPADASGGIAANDVPPLRKVTIIGDSAFAGIRWNGAVGGLQGMVVDHRLESCRRLVQPSCRGREGYTPRTVASELLAMPAAGPEDLLVVVAGYDDWYTRFSSDFDIVTGTARARGFHHIVWVTYRSDTGYRPPGGGLNNYGEMNRVMFEKLASGDHPGVRIWDYDADTAETPPGWFYADGIHERPLGSWGTADWLSRHVAAFDDRPCPQPWVPGEAPDDPCPRPGAVLESGRGFPDIEGLYGL